MPKEKRHIICFISILLYLFSCSLHLSTLFLKLPIKGTTINGVNYEWVAEFIYLGTLISNDNNVQEEIQRRILAGSRTYFAAISLFRNRLLSRATKIRLYKTLIRPVLTYWSGNMDDYEEGSTIVIVLLGISLASICTVPTFRNHVSVPSSNLGPHILINIFL
jgi:hypothetical protein